MSDKELRDFERMYIGGDESVLLRLLSLRFRSDPSLENALPLFNMIWDQTDFQVNLQDSYAHLLLSQDPDSIRDRLSNLNAHPQLFIGPFSFSNPGVTALNYEKVSEARNNTVEIIRKQLPDSDLDRLADIGRIVRDAQQTAQLMIDNDIARFGAIRFISNAISSHLDSYLSNIDLIKTDRYTLREEFSRYLELLSAHQPLEASIIWYQEKCDIFRKRFKRKVLEPNNEVIYAQLPEADGGAFAPECFFPFYDYLSSEFHSGPPINFLAALELNDVDMYHREWEFDAKEEEEETFAETLGISREELLEDDYYDEYRHFEREFEEEILPKKIAVRLEEEIDEIVEQIETEYIDSEEAMTVIKLLQSYEEELFDHYDESLEFLDADIESEVSQVVDEPFESWLKTKTGILIARVVPLDAHEKNYNQYGRTSIPDRNTPWWRLRTRPVCPGKPPMIKLDTRAIGWKAAFGIEPLLLHRPEQRYRRNTDQSGGW